MNLTSSRPSLSLIAQDPQSWYDWRINGLPSLSHRRRQLLIHALNCRRCTTGWALSANSCRTLCYWRCFCIMIGNFWSFKNIGTRHCVIYVNSSIHEYIAITKSDRRTDEIDIIACNCFLFSKVYNPGTPGLMRSILCIDIWQATFGIFVDT